MAAITPTIPSAMDNLSQAIRHHIIPNQEYLLQGSIMDSAVEHLLHRFVCVRSHLSKWLIRRLLSD